MSETIAEAVAKLSKDCSYLELHCENKALRAKVAELEALARNYRESWNGAQIDVQGLLARERDTLTEIAEVACMPFPDLATKDEVVAKVVGLEAELTKLKAFALWALAGYRGDELGDIDGGDLQDKAEALGLLVGVTVTEPCGEGCNCMGWDDFPQTCYRIPEWLA